MLLNFNILTAEERRAHVDKLLSLDKTYSPQDLELMANYILWAIEKEEKVSFQIETSRTKFNQHISYEEFPPDVVPVTDIPLKHPKRNAKLDREHVLKLVENDHFFLPQFLSLWKDIDELEYKIQYHEQYIGKRRPDLPIRQELLDRLKDVNLFELESASVDWTPTDLYKAKYKLQQLRSSQYPLYDQVKEDPIASMNLKTKNYTISTLDDLPLNGYGPVQGLDALLPNEELISKDIMGTAPPDSEPFIFNFTNIEHLRALILKYNDLLLAIENERINTTTPILKEIYLYFNKYIKDASLKPNAELVLKAKVNHKTNKQIAEILGGNYQETYISTLYLNQVLKKIADAAKRHRQLLDDIQDLSVPFKNCTHCGEYLPVQPYYFRERKSLPDGFVNVCKKCQKAKKEKKNAAKNNK